MCLFPGASLSLLLYFFSLSLCVSVFSLALHASLSLCVPLALFLHDFSLCPPLCLSVPLLSLCISLFWCLSLVLFWHASPPRYKSNAKVFTPHGSEGGGWWWFGDGVNGRLILQHSSEKTKFQKVKTEILINPKHDNNPRTTSCLLSHTFGCLAIKHVHLSHPFASFSFCSKGMRTLSHSIASLSQGKLFFPSRLDLCCCSLCDFRNLDNWWLSNTANRSDV